MVSKQAARLCTICCLGQASSVTNYGNLAFAEVFPVRDVTTQARFQIYTLLVTLGIAIASGIICGLILRAMPNNPVSIE